MMTYNKQMSLISQNEDVSARKLKVNFLCLNFFLRVALHDTHCGCCSKRRRGRCTAFTRAELRQLKTN